MTLPTRSKKALERNPEVIQLEETLFLVKSSGHYSPKDWYEVDTEALTCECPDANTRGEVCYHLRAAAIKQERGEVQTL